MILKRKDVEKFLQKYCAEQNISFENARNQLRAFSDDFALLCVSNPDAPEADGLANDYDTLMLPTLYIRKDRCGNLYAEHTEHTKKYLYGI